MSEYAKKLHINYNGTQTDIKLYTTTNDVGNNYISINDGISNIYAKLDTANGTNLHIKKNGIIYNVIKETELILPVYCSYYMKQYYANTYQTMIILPNEMQTADASNVIAMNNMFDECTSLTIIPKLNTINVTNMNCMFYNCKSLKEIPNLNTSKVTDMEYMFYDCSNLITIPQLDTSNVTNMHIMFYGCSNLTTIPQLNTSKVTDMSAMFYYCKSLTAIPQLDTSKTTYMYNMFYGCSKLTTISELDSSKVIDMSDMFYSCTSLPTVFPWAIDCSSITTINEIKNIFYGSSVKEVTFKNVKENIKYDFTADNLGIQLTKITIQNTI